MEDYGKLRKDIAEGLVGGLLSDEEISLAGWLLEEAIRRGASASRISLTKSLGDSVSTLNGEVDKVTHSLDRTLLLAVFVDERSASFSTNRLYKEELSTFLDNALAATRMLSKDPLRTLPDIQRCIQDDSIELSLPSTDIPSYMEMTPERRLSLALQYSRFRDMPSSEDYTIISEEGEYSDLIGDYYIIDSHGMKGRQLSTSFQYTCEVTLQDGDGQRQSGYSWQCYPKWDTFRSLHPEEVAMTALRKALDMRRASPLPGGRYTVALNEEVSSRFLFPVINAINGGALQQRRSFLMDSLGKKLFPECLTVEDRPLDLEGNGPRLMDSEGIRLANSPIIEKGVVRKYFVSTWIANKTGMEPSCDDATKLLVHPTASSLEELSLGRYFLVTGLNGGNSNPVTGDFSFGVEGFVVEGGSRVPFREMVMTGNLLQLWSSLIGIVDTSEPRMTNRIGTLVFGNVDLSGEEEQ